MSVTVTVTVLVTVTGTVTVNGARRLTPAAAWFKSLIGKYY